MTVDRTLFATNMYNIAMNKKGHIFFKGIYTKYSKTHMLNWVRDHTTTTHNSLASVTYKHSI